MRHLLRTALLLLLLSPVLRAAGPTPPAPPAEGPGSLVYPHAGTRMSVHGEGAKGWWLFEPADPVPAEAPVIVFLHGWLAIDPWVYGAWLEHLVRRGNTVIYPRYQTGPLTKPGEFLPNALAAVKDALTDLKTDGRVHPTPGKFAIAGHSVGGLLTANIGSLAAREGLPVPQALCCVQPGRTPREGHFGVPLVDLGGVPETALLLCLTGDRDRVTASRDATTIFRGLTQIPKSRRALLTLRSDTWGSPALLATHFAPCSVLPEPLLPLEQAQNPLLNPGPVLLSAASGDLGPMRAFLRTERGQAWLTDPRARPPQAESFLTPDAADVWYFWRVLDLACDLAFAPPSASGKLPALNPAALRNMGRWSDGRAVTAPEVVFP